MKKVAVVHLKKTDSNYYQLILEKNYKLEYLMYTKAQLAKIVNEEGAYPIVREYLAKKFADGSIVWESMTHRNTYSGSRYFTRKDI